ncbi:branched-chain amino acid ABC transporter, periplasmic branched-chain amino acid-binding protein, putative [Leucobacter sp. 7(1)]|uniref:ABC transporter substrate-binding protein n=1 Tax=Leucobacter sp. 7(1) TaxID=1255613 RepID=UPI00097EFC29|nr:ABC transporter substrate-binding protein [Leucobacter sp. 7(1)]SJN08002.1 branched-chain amino acid ABC transporter, periplasmic branched-chain amino acid-binding protein, putative [Leucobacter sp. 7(1)]
MSEATPNPTPQRKRVTRRDLVRGIGIAGAAGLLAGGAGGFFMSPRRAGTAAAAGGGETIKFGIVAPVTGPYSGDGQEMVRGAELAVEDINAAGGVLGRPVELVVGDIADQAPENFIQVAERLVSREKIAAASGGYTTATSVEFNTYAQAGVPLFHTNTLQENTDYVVKHGMTNIFQCCPTEPWYASGFLQLMQEWIDKGIWVPSAQSAAVISSNDSYSISIATVMQQGLRDMGWDITMYEEVSVPNADWGPQLSKIRNNPPGLIFVTDYLAGDLASFAKQFATAPTPSLLYQQYGPSVPEYIDLAGDAANGVVWSTTIGTLPDEMGLAFRERYLQTYGTEAGLSQSGAQYDIVRLWAQAASRAGDPYDFDAVSQAVSALTFRGVVGTYRFGVEDRTAIPYPDATDDPSLGMPHLTYQIQDGEQVLFSPAPYGKGSFVLPKWL